MSSPTSHGPSKRQLDPDEPPLQKPSSSPILCSSNVILLTQVPSSILALIIAYLVPIDTLNLACTCHHLSHSPTLLSKLPNLTQDGLLTLLSLVTPSSKEEKEDQDEEGEDEDAGDRGATRRLPYLTWLGFGPDVSMEEEEVLEPLCDALHQGSFPKLEVWH